MQKFRIQLEQQV